MALFKKLATTLFIAVSVLSVCKIANADCGETDYDCQEKYYTQKISETQSQEKTLSSQIDLINNQISLTKSKIAVTQDKLDKLSDSISTVSGKITVIEGSLSQVSNILANRIAQTYIVGRNDPVLYLLSASNFSDFWQRFGYLRIVQKHDKELMLQMAASRKNYNDQKQLLEDKKKQQETLSAQLKAQKSLLDKENKDKQSLLTATHNDESRYQQLLAEARAQLAAFGGFVNRQGGGALISADPNWPKSYYSQRDNRWGGMVIGGYYTEPKYMTSISESGCLLSSVAMALSHRDQNASPATIGSKYSLFVNAVMQWGPLESLGFNVPLRTTDRSVIDNALGQNKWVIVGIDDGPCVSQGCSPFHFVVITEKKGNDYNLFDPYRGPNISFNSNYGGKYITEVITY